MTLADLVEGKMGVKRDCRNGQGRRSAVNSLRRQSFGTKLTTSSASPTSRPRSPTNTEYSPSHLGCRPGRPVPQLSLKVLPDLGMRVGGEALKRART